MKNYFIFRPVRYLCLLSVFVIAILGCQETNDNSTEEDMTPPAFSDGYPKLQSITNNGFEMVVNLDKPGTVFYVVVPKGAAAPGPAAVKNGTVSDGGSAKTSGDVVVTLVKTDTTSSATQLDALTAYDVYFVAQDSENSPNLQGNVTKRTLRSSCMAGVKATIVSNNDPLAEYQWHFNNTGQSAFSDAGGKKGADLNMMKSIEGGCSGTGVLVAVVDSGLEINHEDLKGNIVTNGSYDMENDDNDPTPSGTAGDHGTSVAGLVAATVNNGKGGRGIAPEAKLKGFNLITPGAGGTASEILALGAATSNDGTPAFVSDDVDIFNMSYGEEPVNDVSMNTDMENHLKMGVEKLRGGKGAIYVKSGGNGFTGLNNDSSESREACQEINSLGVGCYNVNMEPVQNLPFLIVTGALSAHDVKASYSSTGSSIWISAPGGEYGSDYPAMITTDFSGCTRGYATAGTNRIGETLNPNCNYTQDFNGTSSATPVVSGVAALMLQANPDLFWRDIKHILASTARQVDANIAAVSFFVGSGNYEVRTAWTTNQAGYKFHNWYGFGAVDVDAALAMITTYNPGSLGEFQILDWQENSTSSSIPDFDYKGTSSSILLTGVDNFTIEEVEIQVNITHSYIGDLGIELISPSGTKSILLNAGSRFQNDNDLVNTRLLSNAFYGVTHINGTWTVKVVDVSSEATGTLDNWKIRFYGHKK